MRPAVLRWACVVTLAALVATSCGSDQQTEQGLRSTSQPYRSHHRDAGEHANANPFTDPRANPDASAHIGSNRPARTNSD